MVPNVQSDNKIEIPLLEKEGIAVFSTNVANGTDNLELSIRFTCPNHWTIMVSEVFHIRY